MMVRKKDSHPEKGVIKPSDLDILLGRKRYSFHHVGNRSFRTLIANNSGWYAAVPTKSDKVAVVAFLLNLIQRGGGRFLKKDPSSCQWHEVDTTTARGKIDYALRKQRDQQTFRNTPTSSRNKTDSTNDHSDSEDSMLAGPHSYIDEMQGSQHRAFVPPIQSPDCWSYMVLETLKESMNASKSGAVKNAASFNLQGGAQHDVAMTEPIKLKQLPDSDGYAANRHDTIISDAWRAQRTPTVMPIPQNVHSSHEQKIPPQMPNSWYYSVHEPIQESWTAATSDLNKSKQLDNVTKADSTFELKQAPNANLSAQQHHDRILSEAWEAQRASSLMHKTEMSDIYSPNVKRNAYNSHGILLQPRLVATAKLSPYAHDGPRSTTSFRKQSLRDMPLDNSQETYSLEMGKLCEDIASPLPLTHDSHVSGEIAECLGQWSLEQSANTDAGNDEHGNSNDSELLHAHEIVSVEVAWVTQLGMPDIESSTDQQLEEMVLDLF